MKPKRKFGLFFAVILAIIVGYNFLGQPLSNTIMAQNTLYEDKVSFNGIFFTQEYIVYKGELDKKALQFNEGEKVPRGIKLYQNISSPQAGVVLNHLDGYETSFNLNNIFNSDYRDISKVSDKYEPGIKIINNSEWYIYAITKGDKPYKKYRNYSLVIDNVSYPSEVVKTKTRGKYTYTVFKIKNDLNILNLHRNINGYIIKSVYNGIVVPEKALCSINGKDGVFVKSHGYAEYRRANVVFRGNGTAVITPSQFGKTVQDYDELLTNANGIKDGDKIH